MISFPLFISSKLVSAAVLPVYLLMTSKLLTLHRFPPFEPPIQLDNDIVKPLGSVGRSSDEALRLSHMDKPPEI